MTNASREVMRKTGFRWPEAHRGAQPMAGLALAMRAEAGFENLGIPFCMTVEAEAWGGEIEVGDEITPPSVHRYCLHSVEQWRELKPLDPYRDGRMPIVLECTKLVREAAPDSPVIANLVGPVSLATSLMDATILFRALRREPAQVHQLLAFLTDTCIRYGQALLRAGADVVVISDPSATGEILGPKLFREFTLPYLNRMIEAAHKDRAPVIMHICGNIRSIYEPLRELTADAISVDAVVALRSVRRALPGRKIMGNVSTLLLQTATPSRVAARAKKLIAAGMDILAPACGVSATTPLANLRAMTGVAKELGTQS